MIAHPDATSPVGFRVDRFSEIETTFSVPYRWGSPADTSAYNWTVNNLKTYGQASKGECHTPVAAVLTTHFETASTTGARVMRQQGDAIVLAAGGVCQVAVPYASAVGAVLGSGYEVLTLMPATTAEGGATYDVVDKVSFATRTPTGGWLAAPTTCDKKSSVTSGASALMSGGAGFRFSAACTMAIAVSVVNYM